MPALFVACLVALGIALAVPAAMLGIEIAAGRLPRGAAGLAPPQASRVRMRDILGPRDEFFATPAHAFATLATLAAVGGILRTRDPAWQKTPRT